MSNSSFYQSLSAEESKRFKYWQRRTIIASMIGYALFYFVRKNLSIAMPGMQEDLGITKTDLGLFLTLHGLIYGVSKFANGFIGDRVNARYFMVTGLVLSAVCNIVFGFSAAVLVFGIVWMLNGWFQGMGFPPFLIMATDSLILIAMNAVLQHYGGPEQGDTLIACATIVQSCMSLITGPMLGISSGTQAIISYNYGACRSDRVRQAARCVLRMCLPSFASRFIR